MGFKAVTRIKYSNPNIAPGEAAEVVEFEQGDEVKGLPKEVMKDLWDAGALERTGSDEATTEEASAPSTPASGDGTSTPPPPPE